MEAKNRENARILQNISCGPPRCQNGSWGEKGVFRGDQGFLTHPLITGNLRMPAMGMGFLWETHNVKTPFRIVSARWVGGYENPTVATPLLAIPKALIIIG